MTPAGAALYAASARRVLTARGVHGFGERLRPHEERLVFVFGSPRSGTTFLAGRDRGDARVRRPDRGDAVQGGNPGLGEAPGAADGSRDQACARAGASARARSAAGAESSRRPRRRSSCAAAFRAYPQARAIHLVRDGRDVVCSLLERGWLSAGRGGRRRREGWPTARRARFWVEPDRLDEFEAASDATRAAWAWRRYVTAARSGAGRADARGALRVDRRELPQAIAAHLGARPGAARPRRSDASTTARSVATGATSAPSSSPTSSARPVRCWPSSASPVAAPCRSYRSLRSLLGTDLSVRPVNPGTERLERW